MLSNGLEENESKTLCSSPKIENFLVHPNGALRNSIYFIFNLVVLWDVRRFSVVEKRWREACKSEDENASEDSFSYTVYSVLPTDSELAAAFVERKQRLV